MVYSLLLLSSFFLLALPIFLISLFLLTFRSTSDPYTLRDYPVIGHLPQFLQNRHRIIDWFADLLARSPTNTIYIHRFGGIRGVITANPANVEHVLRTRFDNYPKGPRSNSILADFLGRGIFNSDGEAWKAQRKTASFEFNTRSLRSFVVNSVQGEITDRLIPLLHVAAEQGAVLDLQDVLERFGFDNVCKVAFGEDPACLEELLVAMRRSHGAVAGAAVGVGMAFPEAFRDAATLSAGRFRYALPGSWKVKKLLGFGSERRLHDSIAVVHGFAEKIIRVRKEEKERGMVSREDLLSRFVATGDFSDEYLRDIVISFILAGRETTSSGLSWFFWLLASRPDVEAEILDELRSIRARLGKTREEQPVFGFEELREMHYLHAAITESLRLYPPVPQNSTMSLEDDVLPDGTKVTKGSFLAYSPYAMGRMPAVWGEDCLEYKPERWLVPAEEGDGTSATALRVFRPESPFRFPAFHAGPRLCLGKEMAYIQMKSIAACVLEGFQMEVLGKERRPDQLLSLTLRMKNGLPAKIRCRET